MFVCLFFYSSIMLLDNKEKYYVLHMINVIKIFGKEKTERFLKCLTDFLQFNTEDKDVRKLCDYYWNNNIADNILYYPKDKEDDDFYLFYKDLDTAEKDIAKGRFFTIIREFSYMFDCSFLGEKAKSLIDNFAEEFHETAFLPTSDDLYFPYYIAPTLQDIVLNNLDKHRFIAFYDIENKDLYINKELLNKTQTKEEFEIDYLNNFLNIYVN